MKIAAAIHDLMFSSKVNAAARGQPVAWMPRGGKVAEFVATQAPDLLLIDLGNPKLEPVEAIRAIKSAEATRGVAVVAYIGHEQADLIAAAREAGADQVLSKGEFARRLPELLGG